MLIQNVLNGTKLLMLWLSEEPVRFKASTQLWLIWDGVILKVADKSVVVWDFCSV